MTFKPVAVFVGEELASYGFGERHPFGPDRMDAFWQRMLELGLDRQVEVRAPVRASEEQILRFHHPDYVALVREKSVSGEGYLDCGDTPAFPGVYEAACTVVGSVLAALDEIMSGSCRQAFVPIAGLHHARRDQAAGFCVFNDCGIAIETLRSQYGVRRIVYVDIDAHHGDGVFYAFEDDPELIFVDLHEDGRFLYPGTGSVEETGTGNARSSKLNIPMPPDADDETFFRMWEPALRFLERAQPEVVLLQCGADSLAGDPITHLGYTEAAHAHAARSLQLLAERYCDGRLLALGGGGYNRDNLARAWTAVVAVLLGERA